MGTEKKNTKIRFIIIACCAAVIIAVLLILFFNGVFSCGGEKSGEGVVGVVSDGWDDGIENDTATKNSGTQIPGYSTAEMNSGDMSLKIRIGNPKENKVGMFATLKLSDGTVLYESELLKPGQGLEEVPLSKTLDKGTYDAVVLYQCVALDENNTHLNAAESGFKLIVK